MSIVKDQLPVIQQKVRPLVVILAALALGAFVVLSVTLYAVQQLRSTVHRVEDKLSSVKNDSQIVLSKLRTEEDGLIDEPGSEEQVRFATVGDAESVIKKLGDQPSADSLAESIMTMDGWLIKPGEEERFKKLKLDQQSRLRQLVKGEVQMHQDSALMAPTSAEAVKEHSEAGRVLAMYPMSDEHPVIEEARQLATRHADVAGRLEALRRQRYNRWATGQIEKALDFYNANVSHFNPFNDNSVLIDSLVKNLGEVDPAGLEPAVIELYNYVIDRTKGSISEKNKVELAKRLTDPSVHRKSLEDL